MREKKAGKCFYFSYVFSFLCLVNSASPESSAAGVSFRVDTGTLGTSTFSLLPGKTYEELFYQTGSTEYPFFSISFVFIFKTCRW